MRKTRRREYSSNSGRRRSQLSPGALSENLTKVGLTIDKFLQSKKITLEEYRAQTINEARDDLKKKFLV